MPQCKLTSAIEAKIAEIKNIVFFDVKHMYIYTFMWTFVHYIIMNNENSMLTKSITCIHRFQKLFL